MKTQDIINCWETGVEPYNATKHQPYTTVWTNHGGLDYLDDHPQAGGPDTWTDAERNL